jgi:hypothetical protein
MVETNLESNVFKHNTDIKIIAISGKAQHGKDTFADALKEELISRGHRVLVTHYADLLKYICKTFFNWDGQKDEKGRKILQYVGTDVVRKQCPDYWVTFTISIIQMFSENWDYVLIPDTRFPNEVDMLKQHFDNVEHIRVVRPNFVSTLTEEQKNHPSEVALDNTKPDRWFINNSSIEIMKDSLKEMEF